MSLLFRYDNPQLQSNRDLIKDIRLGFVLKLLAREKTYGVSAYLLRKVFVDEDHVTDFAVKKRILRAQEKNMVPVLDAATKDKNEARVDSWLAERGILGQVNDKITESHRYEDEIMSSPGTRA